MKLKLFFVLLSFLYLESNLSAQSFPERCTGVWQGTMYMWTDNKIVDSVEIQLTVAPLEDTLEWTWRTEYNYKKVPVQVSYYNDSTKLSDWKTEYKNAENYLVKDYVLIEGLKNEELLRTGWFVLDEGDGIRLGNQVFGNKMYCAFQVDGFTLTSTYELVGDQLIFEVTSGVNATHSDPSIITFTFDHLQRVVFTKFN